MAHYFLRHERMPSENAVQMILQKVGLQARKARQIQKVILARAVVSDVAQSGREVVRSFVAMELP